MSALPPKADIAGCDLDVRFVPKADIGTSLVCQLLDQLVGALLKIQRHVEAESLSGLKIDGQFVLSRRLHRHIGRLFTLEDAINVTGRASELIGEIHPVGDQTASGGPKPVIVYRGQSVPSRQRYDASTSTA